MIQTDNREVQGEFLTQREYIVYKLLIFLPAIDKSEYAWYYIIKERPKSIFIKVDLKSRAAIVALFFVWNN